MTSLLFGDTFVTSMAALLGVFAPVSPVICQARGTASVAAKTPKP